MKLLAKALESLRHRVDVWRFPVHARLYTILTNPVYGACLCMAGEPRVRYWKAVRERSRRS